MTELDDGVRCSAMGCRASVEEREVRDYIMFVERLDDRYAGVTLAFCQSHAEAYLSRWAGLLIGTSVDESRMYAVVELVQRLHRFVVQRGIESIIENRVKEKTDGSS